MLQCLQNMREEQSMTTNNMENTMSSKAIACIISGSGIINIVIDGKSYSVAPDHLNYKPLISAIKSNDQEAIVTYVDIPAAVKSFTSGEVTIVENEVLYNGQSIHMAISSRILGLMQDELPYKFMVCFLGNLMKNPSFRAVTELYGFLEFANIPITDDGCFLAYKRVNEDYTDKHTSSVDNSIGSKPSMPRNMVDEDKDRTCSNGYHFCSLEYIPNFGCNQEDSDDRVMIVKINPMNVVAIPSDYKNTKGRCCDYEVVAEYDGDWRTDAFTKPVHNQDGTPYELKEPKDGDLEEKVYGADGFDSNGYDVDGKDADGYDPYGYDEDGLDQDGLDSDGRDNNGYDKDGLDSSGYDIGGYDVDGFDKDSFNIIGLNHEGFDSNGFDKDGFDVDGFDAEGEMKDEDIDTASDLASKALASVSPDSPEMGLKPSGQRFYNVRNSSGKFVSKGGKS
jgi:hypothetical protein